MPSFEADVTAVINLLNSKSPYPNGVSYCGLLTYLTRGRRSNRLPLARAIQVVIEAHKDPRVASWQTTGGEPMLASRSVAESYQQQGTVATYCFDESPVAGIVEANSRLKAEREREAYEIVYHYLRDNNGQATYAQLRNALLSAEWGHPNEIRLCVVRQVRQLRKLNLGYSTGKPGSTIYILGLPPKDEVDTAQNGSPDDVDELTEKVVGHEVYLYSRLGPATTIRVHLNGGLEYIDYPLQGERTISFVPISGKTLIIQLPNVSGIKLLNSQGRTIRQLDIEGDSLYIY